MHTYTELAPCVYLNTARSHCTYNTLHLSPHPLSSSCAHISIYHSGTCWAQCTHWFNPSPSLAVDIEASSCVFLISGTASQVLPSHALTALILNKNNPLWEQTLAWNKTTSTFLSQGLCSMTSSLGMCFRIQLLSQRSFQNTLPWLQSGHCDPPNPCWSPLPAFTAFVQVTHVTACQLHCLSATGKGWCWSLHHMA